MRLPWLVVLFASASSAQVVPVSDATGLRNAINAAAPGQEIVLAPGAYNVVGNLLCDVPGNAAQPIVVRAATPRTALIRFDAVEGFKVSEQYWRFEGLDIEGVCAADDDCEHAFHIFGAAEFLVLRNNRVRDFNAQVKSGGIDIGGGNIQFPDDVLIENNDFYDTRARNTSNPVTKIDVVGGRRWIVRGNTIYDFQKGLDNFISYAAFLKGNSRDGIFERNLVICERFFTGGIRLGLSFGGGGTGPQFCDGGPCPPEHQNGIMRNNIIVNCPADVGIYLNAATNSRIQHNTLYNTTGIDVRFVESTADIRNNVLSGQIRNRDNGTSTQTANLTQVSNATFAAWFANPAQANFNLLDGSSIVNQGASAPLVTNDFCGTARSDGTNDIGAVEYVAANACDTTLGGGRSVLFADGFE